MKVLHVINRCKIGDGAAKLLLDIAKRQIKEGYTVDILALSNSYPSYKDDFVQAGCGFKYLLSDKSCIKNPKLITLLGKVIQGYDIVHTHLFPTFYWVALAKKIYGGNYKLIHTEHAPKNNRQKWWLRFIERYIYKEYDAIVAISEAVKNRMELHLGSSFNIKIVENGIDVSEYVKACPSSRLDLKIPEDAIILTQAARFSPEKDQRTVVKSLLRLPLNYHVIFLGGGELMNDVKTYAVRLTVDDRVHFLGIRDDLPSIFKMSDIIIMSSNFEGFGLAAVEGMAAMKPVIASNIPGLAHIVDGAGVLFKLHDDKDLANKVKSLIEDKQYYNDVSYKCYMRAERYDICNTVHGYSEIYKSVL